ADARDAAAAEARVPARSLANLACVFEELLDRRVVAVCERREERPHRPGSLCLPNREPGKRRGAQVAVRLRAHPLLADRLRTLAPNRGGVVVRPVDDDL